MATADTKYSGITMTSRELLLVASPRADWQAGSQRLAARRLPVCPECWACHVGVPLLEYGADYVPCWHFWATPGWVHACANGLDHVHLDPALWN